MKNRHSQRGLSLIELMIGILLASILLLGVLQIFDGNRRTYRLQEAFSRVQESGRIATDLLARELRNAAFDGCVENEGNLKNLSGSSLFDGNLVDGEEDVAANTTIGSNNTEVLAGTDVLRVRGALDACAGIGRMTGASGTQVNFTGNCAIDANEYVMVADCQAGDIVQATADASGGQLSVNATLYKTYGPEARLYKTYVREYFISDDTTTGRPGLFVSENNGDAQELVPGVEDLQLRFGRDSAGNNDVVDIWGDAPADINESEEVAAVRVQLIVAAEDTAGAGKFEYTRLGGDAVEVEDGRLRKQFVVYTKLRNRGAR